MLLRRSAPQLTAEQAGWIAQALGDLPLALAQAAADLLAQGTPATYPVSLAASVQIALDRLAVQCPAAPQLLRRCPGESG